MTKSIEEKIRERVERDVRATLQRPKRESIVPYGEAYLAERAEFNEKWVELTALGRDRGFLDYSDGYGSALVVETALGMENGWEYADTDEEWEQRVQIETDRVLAQDR